jgi:hypothetical protein
MSIPFLSGSGDLGVCLYNLILSIEKLGKTATTERLCSCTRGAGSDNDATPTRTPAAPPPDTSAAYAALCGVLAACGRVDALRLVEGFCPTPRPPAPRAAPESTHESLFPAAHSRGGDHRH